MSPRVPDPYDPVLQYHLSDRDFNRRTYYGMVGLYVLLGGTTLSMFVMRLLGY